MSNDWRPLEPDLESIFSATERPLEALALAATPALILRGAMAPAECERTVGMLIDRGLLYDARVGPTEAQAAASIPEGYYRDGRNGRNGRSGGSGGNGGEGRSGGDGRDGNDEQAWQQARQGKRRRIDVGTSLGYRGSDPESFFSHSQETLQLFRELFPDDATSPIARLYDALTALSVNKKAVTAREPDGRLYGPAIIRAHYGGYTYAPHFDSVRLREKRDNYAVSEYEHQFAGVLVLQNTTLKSGPSDRTAQCVLHQCLWSEAVEPHLRARTFHQYASENNVANVEVVLEPGDMYFFNTRCIHEVPGVAGDLPRIVVATFIGYSGERDEIFVWA